MKYLFGSPARAVRGQPVLPGVSVRQPFGSGVTAELDTSRPPRPRLWQLGQEDVGIDAAHLEPQRVSRRAGPVGPRDPAAALALELDQALELLGESRHRRELP